MKCVTQLFRIIIVDIGDSQDGFFSLFKKISILGVTNDRRTFSCLLSCARGMKPQRKQTDVKDVQVVVASQKMEQVKNTRGSAPFRATFYYVRLNGWKT